MTTRPTISKLSEATPFWNALIYGDSGVGKTVFAGSDLKVLFVAPEDGGTLSAQKMGSSAEKITIKKWEDIKQTYDYFSENPGELSEYNVMAIDSISEMQFMAKEFILRMSADEKRRKGQDPDKLQLQDYGVMHELVENMVRGFNDLPVNVLWTATAKKVEDADGNEFLVPDLQGKKDYGIALKMVALMTSYGYMRTEVIETLAPTEDDPNNIKAVKKRVVYWEDTGSIRGKDRTCALAPFTVNLTLQAMRLAIAGKMKRNPDGTMTKVGAERAGQASPKPVVSVAKGAADKETETVVA
jgi:hypothetical protein